MPQFTYTGSEVKVFPTLSNPDGTTLEVKPGDVVTLDTDPQLADFTAASAPAPEATQTASEAPTTDATPSA